MLLTAKKLILAMAPLDTVLEELWRLHPKKILEDETMRDPRCRDCCLHWQDSVARLVESCWNNDAAFGPSQRYLKRLVQQYVHQLEHRAGGGGGGPTAVVESDALSELLLRVSLSKDRSSSEIPHPEESCFLSFQLPSTSQSSTNNNDDDAVNDVLDDDDDNNNDCWLRIRVFPYHNDVALRLWEAGATMAEFFVCPQNRHRLENKHVIELGAGVGLTGLVIAAYCHPKSVFLTDYTDVCRTNLQHNLAINQKWLLSKRATPHVLPKEEGDFIGEVGTMPWCERAVT